MQDEMFDSLESEVARLRRELDELKAERDALAAHVERLHMAWVDAKRCVSVAAFPALYRVEQYQHLAKRSIEKLESVVSDTPATSLARMRDERAQAIQRAVKQARRDWAREDKAAIERRDLLKQAEALSEMIAAIPFSEELAREMLKHKRDELRRQAEDA